MKWTLQVLYSQILLIVLCLSFPSPDIQAAGTDRRSRDTYQTKTSSDKITDKVTGKITTADGEPLAGASVIIKGTRIGTSADIDGNYSIKAPAEGESYTLVFQYLGMRTKEITVSGQRH